MLLMSQLGCAGQISRMADHCLTKITVYDELFTGYRERNTVYNAVKE